MIHADWSDQWVIDAMLAVVCVGICGMIRNFTGRPHKWLVSLSQIVLTSLICNYLVLAAMMLFYASHVPLEFGTADNYAACRLFEQLREGMLATILVTAVCMSIWCWYTETNTDETLLTRWWPLWLWTRRVAPIAGVQANGPLLPPMPLRIDELEGDSIWPGEVESNSLHVD